MFQKVVLVVAAVLGCGILVVSPARAETQGFQCIKLEQKITKCSSKKQGKVSRQAAQQCKAHKRAFSNSCAAQPVCGQPAFSCPDGFICAQVMPAPKSYPSLSDLKSDGAEFLYYGECLDRAGL